MANEMDSIQQYFLFENKNNSLDGEGSIKLLHYLKDISLRINEP